MTEDHVATGKGWLPSWVTGRSPKGPGDDAPEDGNAPTTLVDTSTDDPAEPASPQSWKAPAPRQQTVLPEESAVTDDADQSSAAAPTDQVVVDEPFETDDGLVHFGPPAVLKAIPVRPADQPGDVLEYVPDIALDWLDVDVGSARAVSARGHMHRHLGEVRQDSYAFHAYADCVVIAVADGVGNASASHLGSALAARSAVLDANLRDQLREVDADLTTETLDGFGAVLTHEAKKRGVDPLQLSTNLIVALIPAKADGEGIFDVTLLKIGDPSAWRREEEGWTECQATKDESVEHEERDGRDPERKMDEDSSGPESTATDALPKHTEATLWREQFNAGDVLALASDGVGNIFNANPGFACELSALWRTSAPAPAILLKFLDATVKSFDDDRTFVGYRFS